MARQKGLFKVSGTLEGVNFYVVKGVSYARKAGGGFNGKAIKTKASMQRVRENASEFGHCSKVKKAFRLALHDFIYGIKGKDFHSRMMRLFLEIKALDFVSERGKRRVLAGLQTAKGRRLLKQFDFLVKQPMVGAFKDQAVFDWNTQVLTVSGFNASLFPAPNTATHIGVCLGVLDFDFEGLDASMQCSAIHFMEVGAGASSFTLVPEDVLFPQHVGIAVVGFRYYELIENEMYAFDKPVGVGVVDCKV
ncbi:hypothetical protein [Oceanihabitans sediminis]|uniref:hypothetical protein n=1 Tax=Oceanihabitans sediminis TaxID=1812012 RepID=UPI003A8E05FF